MCLVVSNIKEVCYTDGIVGEATHEKMQIQIINLSG